MNVTCIKCKATMKCTAKRQNVGGELCTMSDFKCPSCYCEVTVSRKGLRQQEDIAAGEDRSDDGE